jgi:tetratricopeptide (TPR) repeat protein
LVACGRAAEAGALLDFCAATYGSDQRHQQLAALVLSRTGRLDEAVKAADALLKRYPDDDETAGITGGIYKRRWDRDATQTKALDKAHTLYKSQWERGKKINAYLGVNAAATAVYRGELDAARAIGVTVVEAMDKRDAALKKAGLDPKDGGLAEYYDRVSRAEALLVSGATTDAVSAYQSAFAAYPLLTGSIEGTRGQANRIANVLGLGQVLP